MVRMLVFADSSVYPSGAALATRPAPRMLFPPRLFSTRNGCLSCSASFCAKSLVTMSLEPPAARVTMIFTGLVGYAALDCAWACPVHTANSEASRAAAKLGLFTLSVSLIIKENARFTGKYNHTGHTLF